MSHKLILVLWEMLLAVNRPCSSLKMDRMHYSNELHGFKLGVSVVMQTAADTTSSTDTLTAGAGSSIQPTDSVDAPSRTTRRSPAAPVRYGWYFSPVHSPSCP